MITANNSNYISDNVGDEIYIYDVWIRQSNRHNWILQCYVESLERAKIIQASIIRDEMKFRPNVQWQNKITIRYIDEPVQWELKCNHDFTGSELQ
jgi:hypothetical protein